MALRKAAASLNSLKVELEGGNNQRLYPGQCVNGTVSYKSAGDERVRSLTIDFRGVSKVTPGKRSGLPTEHVEFFHHSQRLVSNEFWTKHGQRYTWDFSFDLPATTGPDRSAGVYADAGNPLFDEKPHRLPPSLDADQSSEVSVEYQVYAVLGKATRAWEGDSELAIKPQPCSFNARLVPDREGLPPHADRLLEEPLGVPAAPKRRLSLRSLSIGSASGANGGAGPAIGEVCASVAAKFPESIVPGQALSFSYDIRAPEEGSAGGSFDPAAFTHKATSVSLLSLTHRRTAKSPHGLAFTESKTLRLGAPRPTDVHGAEDGGSGGVSAGRLNFLLPAPPLDRMPPSFRTYNVARQYKLQVQSSFSQKGRKEECVVSFEAEVELIYIHGQEEGLRRRESYAMPPPPPPLMVPEEGDDELPDYSPRE